MEDMYYYYGMKLRPYGIGCQPKGMELLIDCERGARYWSIIYSTKMLSKEQCEAYDLDYLGSINMHLYTD